MLKSIVDYVKNYDPKITWRKVLIGLIVTTLSMWWAIHSSNQFNYKCHDYNEFKKTSINGIVIDKYRDGSNHSYPIVLIRNFFKHDTIELNLASDTTKLFSNLDKYDVVYKPYGDSVLQITRQNKTFKIMIDFGCERR